MLHHPLRDLPFSDGNSGENLDDEADRFSDATELSSMAGESERMTVSTRRSHLSLDPDQSLTSLTIQVKRVPLRFIDKPDFPQTIHMHLVQELHVEFPVFCIKCSLDGQYIAVAGGGSTDNPEETGGQIAIYPLITIRISREHAEDELYTPPLTCILFDPESVASLARRTGAVLDICWTAKPGFLFTAGMDKQVSLWHVTNRSTPLMLLPHPDVISSISIHPKDDRLLLTGCIDGRLRLWSVETARVQTSIDLPHPITAVCFTPSGRGVIAGTASGHLYIYGFDEYGALKYHSQIHVRSRRGRNAAGTAKVSGLQCIDGPNGDPMILVTTNDSRVRLYRLRDKEVKFKFHGIVNEDSQLRAVIQGDLVCCASEDGRVGLWRVPDMSKSFFLTLTEKIRGRVLVDSLVSFRAALGRVSESEEQLLPGQPLATSIFLPDSVYDVLVAAHMRLPSSTDKMHPKHIITGDMTGRVKVFEWGSDLSAFILNKDT